MAKTVADVMNMVKENEVKFVDFRFTDTRGKGAARERAGLGVRRRQVHGGHAFDGSSIAGWKGIEASDMLMPDPNSANIDPSSKTTLAADLRRHRARPTGNPTATRARQARAEAYLKGSRRRRHRLLRSRSRNSSSSTAPLERPTCRAFVTIESGRSRLGSTPDYEDGNTGHRPGRQGRLLPGAAVD